MIPIESQSIAGMYDKILIGPRLQAGGEITVDFYDMQLGYLRQKTLGQSPQTGTDLQHPIPGIEVGGGQNTFDHMAILQEVLSETFFGTMFHESFSRLRRGRRGQRGIFQVWVTGMIRMAAR